MLGGSCPRTCSILINIFTCSSVGKLFNCVFTSSCKIKQTFQDKSNKSLSIFMKSNVCVPARKPLLCKQWMSPIFLKVLWFVSYLMNLTGEGGYSIQQVFNVGKSGFYWTWLPLQTYTAKEEKTA
jgi:hypothetical protein